MLLEMLQEVTGSLKMEDGVGETDPDSSLAAFNSLVAVANAEAHDAREEDLNGIEGNPIQQEGSGEGVMDGIREPGWKLMSPGESGTGVDDKEEGGKELVDAGLAGRGGRRRGAAYLGSCTISQAAIIRRKVKDLEIGDNVTRPGGFAESTGRKRGGKDATQWEKYENEYGLEAKRQALDLCHRELLPQDEQIEFGGRKSAQWSPKIWENCGKIPRQQKQSALLSATDDLMSGMRRRGRPPGSGNRKPMEPQRTGPDGTKHFNLRSPRFTGVYRTPAGRWRAQFCHRGQVVQLGMYDDENTAARRWDIEAIRLRGNKTQLNFPSLKAAYRTHLETAEKLNLSYDSDLPENALPDPDTLGSGLDASTRFTGVFCTATGRWKAQFSNCGETVELGTFDSEATAARRWDMEAVRVRGDEAQLNFPSLKPSYLKHLRQSDDPEIGFGLENPSTSLPLDTVQDGRYSTAAPSALYQMFTPSNPLQEINPLGGDEFTWGDADTRDSIPTSLSTFPTDAQRHLLDDTLQASLQETLTDPWAMLSLVTSSEDCREPKMVPEAIVQQMRNTLEGIVSAADKDIEMMKTRLVYASHIVQYGESMKEDAQMCKSLYTTRQQSAALLLEKFSQELADGM